MNIDVLIAANQWWEENKDKGAHDWVKKTLPFLFDTLNALYFETRKLPLSFNGTKIERPVTKSYTFTNNLFLNPEDYRTLRLIAAFCGDIYDTLEPLQSYINTHQFLELTPYIKNLYEASNWFREFRNFFTHIGEVVTKMEKHGISGPRNSKCGISYTESAKFCVHLVCENNTVYFTWRKNEYEVSIDQPAFRPIFKTGTDIYKGLIGNEANRKRMNCTPAEELYPDYNNG